VRLSLTSPFLQTPLPFLARYLCRKFVRPPAGLTLEERAATAAAAAVASAAAAAAAATSVNSNGSGNANETAVNVDAKANAAAGNDDDDDAALAQCRWLDEVAMAPLRAYERAEDEEDASGTGLMVGLKGGHAPPTPQKPAETAPLAASEERLRGRLATVPFHPVVSLVDASVAPLNQLQAIAVVPLPRITASVASAAAGGASGASAGAPSLPRDQPREARRRRGPPRRRRVLVVGDSNAIAFDWAHALYGGTSSASGSGGGTGTGNDADGGGDGINQSGDREEVTEGVDFDVFWVREHGLVLAWKHCNDADLSWRVVERKQTWEMALLHQLTCDAPIIERWLVPTGGVINDAALLVAQSLRVRCIACACATICISLPLFASPVRCAGKTGGWRVCVRRSVRQACQGQGCERSRVSGGSGNEGHGRAQGRLAHPVRRGGGVRRDRRSKVSAGAAAPPPPLPNQQFTRQRDNQRCYSALSPPPLLLPACT